MIICFVFAFILGYSESKACTVPEYIRGDFFYMKYGIGLEIKITESEWDYLKCRDRYDHPKPDKNIIGGNHTFLFEDITSSNCLCVDVLWRTPNVVQFRNGYAYGCDIAPEIAVTTCEGVLRGLPTIDTLTTLFRNIDMSEVSCATMFDGTYQFTYEKDIGGGGICDSQGNRIEYCDGISSDSSMFRMTYAKCSDVAASENKDVRYVCYGTWLATRIGANYKYAVVADMNENEKHKNYKCLLTRQHNKMPPNEERWVMSRFADCSHLNSVYNGPVRLALTKTANCSTMTTSEITSSSTDGIAKLSSGMSLATIVLTVAQTLCRH